jgi:signal transduction histidine kinase
VDVSRANLAEALAARLAPLLAIFAALLAIGAPLAHHVVGVREVRVGCQALASQVAEVLAHEADERPVLWRYDSIKIIAHLRTYRLHQGVAAIDVLDARNRSTEAGSSVPNAPALWCSHAVRSQNQPVGAVWVAMDLSAIRRTSLLLLGVFAVLGVLLGGVVYTLALRTASRASKRIEDLVDDLQSSRAAVEALNVGLEKDVQARTEELREAYSELRHTAARAVMLQEDERRAIGRDLHDSVGQALTAIRIHAQLAVELSDDEAQRAKVLARVCSTTDAALEELRRALARLGPAVLDEVGLRQALDRMLDAFSDHSKLIITREIADVRDLSPALELAIYRIAQEALTNTAKHASASRVSVTLRRLESPARCQLVVRDDGVGIADDASSYALKTGRMHRRSAAPQAAAAGPNTSRAQGLRGMRERAELLGGQLTVESAADTGTIISATLPIARDDAPMDGD